MKKCSFLSSAVEIIDCFKECPFYEWEENDGKCPFEEELKIKKIEIKKFEIDHMGEDFEVSYDLEKIYSSN